MADRFFDSHCATCDDLCVHIVHADDPGSCACTRCGTVLPLVVPLS